MIRTSIFISLFIVSLACVFGFQESKENHSKKNKKSECEYIIFDLDSSYNLVKDVKSYFLENIQTTFIVSKITDTNFVEVDFLLRFKKDESFVKYAVLKQSNDTLLLEAFINIPNFNFLQYFSLDQNKREILKYLKKRYNISIPSLKSNCISFSPSSEFDNLSFMYTNEKISALSYTCNNIPH